MFAVSLDRKPHEMESANVEVAVSAHIVDVLVEGVSFIECHSETLDVFFEGDWCPATVTEMSEVTDRVSDNIPNTADSDLSAFSAKQLRAANRRYRTYKPLMHERRC